MENNLLDELLNKNKFLKYKISEYIEKADSQFNIYNQSLKKVVQCKNTINKSIKKKSKNISFTNIDEKYNINGIKNPSFSILKSKSTNHITKNIRAVSSKVTSNFRISSNLQTDINIKDKLLSSKEITKKQYISSKALLIQSNLKEYLELKQKYDTENNKLKNLIEEANKKIIDEVNSLNKKEINDLTLKNSENISKITIIDEKLDILKKEILNCDNKLDEITNKWPIIQNIRSRGFKALYYIDITEKIENLNEFAKLTIEISNKDFELKKLDSNLNQIKVDKKDSELTLYMKISEIEHQIIHCNNIIQIDYINRFTPKKQVSLSIHNIDIEDYVQNHFVYSNKIEHKKELEIQNKTLNKKNLVENDKENGKKSRILKSKLILYYIDTIKDEDLRLKVSELSSLNLSHRQGKISSNFDNLENKKDLFINKENNIHIKFLSNPNIYPESGDEVNEEIINDSYIQISYNNLASCNNFSSNTMEVNNIKTFTNFNRVNNSNYIKTNNFKDYRYKRNDYNDINSNTYYNAEFSKNTNIFNSKNIFNNTVQNITNGLPKHNTKYFDQNSISNIKLKNLPSQKERHEIKILADANYLIPNVYFDIMKHNEKSEIDNRNRIPSLHRGIINGKSQIN